MTGGHFAQVAVIGLPDPVAGEQVHAIAIPADAGLLTDPPLAAATISAALRAGAVALPAYMVPRDIELVAALPVTPNGKVDYKSLRAARSAP